MKTFIQLDVQNLFFSARDKNKRIDFRSIRNHFFNSEDTVVGLNAYTVRTPDAKYDGFEKFMKSIGYNLNIKKAIISYDREGERLYKGTDHDIAICVDCMSKIDIFDKWVLMSGDGDFIDLCKYLKRKGKVVEIWSVPGISFNKNLCNYADCIYFLGDEFFLSKENEPKQENVQ